MSAPGSLGWIPPSLPESLWTGVSCITLWLRSLPGHPRPGFLNSPVRELIHRKNGERPFHCYLDSCSVSELLPPRAKSSPGDENQSHGAIEGQGAAAAARGGWYLLFPQGHLAPRAAASWLPPNEKERNQFSTALFPSQATVSTLHHFLTSGVTGIIGNLQKTSCSSRTGTESQLCLLDEDTA